MKLASTILLAISPLFLNLATAKTKTTATTGLILSKDMKTFNGAKAACAKLGRTLFTKVQDTKSVTAAKTALAKETGEVWVGLTFKNKAWHRISAGSKKLAVSAKTLWGTGEDKPGKNENCASYKKDGKLMSSKCDRKLKYLCSAAKKTVIKKKLTAAQLKAKAKADKAKAKKAAERKKKYEAAVEKRLTEKNSAEKKI